MMTTITSHSAQETKDAAAALAEQLRGGDMVALVGDLGAGKTTFVQGLAAALGVTVRVKSPTFAVMHEYPCSYGAIRRLLHLDLYRFHSAQELQPLSLEDELRADTVMVMEWPNILPDVTWHPAFTVTMAPGSTEDERMITITNGGAM